MTKFFPIRFAAVLLFSLLLTSVGGCGEAYRAEAKIYATAAQDALIEQGICTSYQDCSQREILFWEGGNPWIPSLKKVFIHIYGVKDLAVITAVEKSIGASKASTVGPPCLLTAYSSTHSEPKVKLREVIIH